MPHAVDGVIQVPKLRKPTFDKAMDESVGNRQRDVRCPGSAFRRTCKQVVNGLRLGDMITLQIIDTHGHQAVMNLLGFDKLRDGRFTHHMADSLGH